MGTAEGVSDMLREVEDGANGRKMNRSGWRQGGGRKRRTALHYGTPGHMVKV
ncbi:hypothetical protein C725_1586 [Pacificimonas flava]|uniref:Uncharacterized protein n=1 Tax=Pacificimonas flava TaxID=1234595 RepID=M2U4S7_9SPHN|nr:hypothetical protein C725_1586 [Pacificimonas flava]